VIENSLPLSAVEHWAYCPRQCMLIHAEQAWADNVSTVRGIAAHRTVDEGAMRAQPGRRLHHAVTVWSDRLGVVGVCDAVEEDLATGQLSPVEHKLGALVGHGAMLQVTAQAMCLEEITGQDVTRGWVFSRTTRRRHPVPVADPRLRAEAVATIDAIRNAMNKPRLPPAIHDRRCDDCSLVEVCLPWLVEDPGESLRLADQAFDA
jgi:CRISPR-associated exonuclease Cas4